MSATFHIPAGSRIPFGVPAQPLPEGVRERVARGLSSIPGILEAHLPMCHVFGTMPEPAQVLVVVFGRGADPNAAMPAIIELVGTCVPQDSHLDVWPLYRNDPLVYTIRKVGCRLLAAEAKPWWKFWG